MALTIRSIKQHTTPLADSLAASGVDAARLAALAPGGADNPGRDVLAWMKYYGSLRVLRASVPDGSDIATPEQAARADRLILEALGATPVPVMIAGAPVDGLSAHAKSFVALLKIHTRNLLIRELLAFVQALRHSEDPRSMELVDEALTEVAYQHRVIAWIACTEGPGLPFAETDAAPELPERFRDISPLAIPAICRAYDEANGARLQALEYLIAPDPDEEDDAPKKRPSWSQFIAAVAGDKEAAETVMRDRPLVTVFAQVQLNASSHREAMAESKRRAAQREEPSS